MLLLDESEADPPQDVIRITADDEPLIDLTFGELADLGEMLLSAVVRLFKAQTAALEELRGG